ncbi:MAG TPA: peptide-methionine (R)-S-oxide reductase MsrB [Ignavibacteriaceae bacterium]|nr:peptide-methionine (R)-S-oxide reductase MsrB [Ignavibacteriaceae bacterium]
MKMKVLILSSLLIVLLILFISFKQNDPKKDGPKITVKVDKDEKSMPNKVVKSNEEWKKILTPEQYQVTREKGTERPFSGKFDNYWEKGIYRCSNCGAELFKSETKFDAGCGWPSFYQAIDDGNIKIVKDYSHNMVREEVRCGICDAHLGHVFDDGPKPTGKRYCMNSVALDFEKKEK